jgi:hypothetical protein
MILGLSCKVKEENWEQHEEWEEQEKDKKSAKSTSERHERGEKRRNSTADLQEEERKKERRVTRKGAKTTGDEPSSPQDVTAGSSLYTSTSPRCVVCTPCMHVLLVILEICAKIMHAYTYALRPRIRFRATRHVGCVLRFSQCPEAHAECVRVCGPEDASCSIIAAE